MAIILNIESSTEVCSVSLAKEGKILQIRENLSGQNHSMLMTVYVDEVFKAQDIPMKNLDAVAVSGGPGSYTGLRIEVAAAKGICYALNIPMIAISSLAAMTDHVIHNKNRYQLPENMDLIYCPMIDARRMEVYNALFNHQGEMIRGIQADIIDQSSFTSYLDKGKIVFFGNGSEKCKSAIHSPNAVFLDNIKTSAGYMTALSEKAYEEKMFVDVAYYEPYYLKDFVATVPTKNIF